MIAYTENPKEVKKKYILLIIKISKVERHDYIKFNYISN